MIPVDQTISDSGKGDCLRAAVASIMELPIEAVPHFALHGAQWSNVYYHFFLSLGWEYTGLRGYNSLREWRLKPEESLNGYNIGTVPSRNFEGKTHAVVIDMTGTVVHDPDPNKKYQGENVIETKALKHWETFSRKSK